MTKLFADVRPLSWAKFGALALVLAIVYYGAFERLIEFDWPQEDFNYCYLIPFVVLFFIWEKREDLARVPSTPSWKGFLPVGLGIVLFWLGDLGGEFFSLYISFWLVVVGLIWAHVGWEKIRVIWFALVMMLAMFPLPNIIYVRLTFGLKLISSQLGVGLLQLYGMSAYREGNVIDLGFTQLQVVEACSGLRYLMPLVVLSLILAYWSRAHIWKKAFMVVSSIPIAIFVNSFRIAATGVLYSTWGASVAEGFFHGFSGWLIFMFTLPILLVEMWILGKLPPKWRKYEEREQATRDDGGDGVASNPESKTQNPKSPFLHPVFITTMVLLILTAVSSRAIDFREKTPIKKPLSSLPLAMGEWVGDKERMEQQFIDALHFSDYAMVDFRNGKNQTVSFYTAYYESQSKGEATHSPETCLPGSGWEFRDAGSTTIPLGQGRSITINRAFIEKTGAKQLTYYWFAQRGRVLTNLYQVKWYSFWDALTKQRTDGALVRLITPVYGNEKIEDAEKRLQDFTKEIVPVLKEYIPE